MHKRKNKPAIFGVLQGQRSKHLADSTLLHALTFEFENIKGQLNHYRLTSVGLGACLSMY